LSFTGIIGLLTRFPVRGESLEETARSAHLLPVVGFIVGIVLYAISLPVALFLPADLAAVLLLTSIYLLTGILHLDGLADMGDAMALPTSPEERRRVMKDAKVGVGGILAVITVLLIELASLRSLLGIASPQPLYGVLPLGILASVLITSEVAAKLSMGVSMAIGRPVEGGMGTSFVRSFGAGRLLAVLVISLLISLVVAGQRAPIVLVGAAVGGGAALVANRSLGGVSGDVVGASNELGRAITLAAWTVVLWML
jgi:adenosylcobinamide-GDP ribazoletransferase